MSNFDEWGNQPEFDSGPGGTGIRQRTSETAPGSGGWHWLLSLISLLIVFTLSMGMAYLTRAVEERPVWMMGLIFMIPTAALMTAVMMVESATSAMTPGTSRRPQIRLAVLATIATFIVACICDLIYLQGFRKIPEPAKSVLTAYEAYDRIILVPDTTASMKENGAHEQETKAVQEILDGLPDQCEAGLVARTAEINLQKLTDRHRAALLDTVRQAPAQGRIYYADLLTSALNMTERAGVRGTTRIIFLTDGRHPWSSGKEDDLLKRCRADQAKVYYIPCGDTENEILAEYAEQTGGEKLDQRDVKAALQGISHARYAEQVAPAEVPKEIRLRQDLIRNRDVSAKIITCIMLTLEGLSLGICLSLMMSVTGQFRIQYIISPVMGILAFFLLKEILSQDHMAETWWIKEGLSFSLLGIVLMARNRKKGFVSKNRPGTSGNGDLADTFYGSDSF